MKQKIAYSFFLFFSLIFSVEAQELFPHADPASNIPKGVLGIRIANEGFNEITQFRSQQNVKFMFGFSPKLMMTESFSFSNHHGLYFPEDFIKNDAAIGHYTNGVKKGNKYPYQFENLNVKIKYRFLSRDEEKEHFRMSAYLELAGGNEAHDEAEPSLSGDNGGIGAGLTATKLKNRFAISATIGGIVPQKYYYQRLDSTLQVKYGKALTYSLSMGLLCLPLKYKNYEQLNVNVYAEFVGKVYDGAKVYSDNAQVLIANVPALEKGSYLEFRPSVQFIFHSNLRVDLSVGTPVVNRSYAHSLTVYYVNVQRYFYFK
ncbi:MAG: hypothetical protein ACXVPU_10995 [Bacteroidia bacterium]